MEAPHVDPLEPAYNGIYPDGRPNRSTAYAGLHPDGDPSESLLKDPSKSTAYTGLHPDGDPSGSLLKDGGSPMSMPQSQPIMGYAMMAARADPRPIRVFIPMPTPRRVS